MKIDWGCVITSREIVAYLFASNRGNAIIISSTAACSIGLTWGGIEFSWNSGRVLVPLILGVVGIAAFLLYEAKLTKFPLVRTESQYDLFFMFKRRFPCTSSRTELVSVGM